MGEGARPPLMSRVPAVRCWYNARQPRVPTRNPLLRRVLKLACAGGILAVAQGAILLALILQALVVAASIAGARFLRFCFLAACRLAPRGARFAGGSVALARRALR